MDNWKRIEPGVFGEELPILTPYFFTVETNISGFKTRTVILGFWVGFTPSRKPIFKNLANNQTIEGEVIAFQKTPEPYEGN